MGDTQLDRGRARTRLDDLSEIPAFDQLEDEKVTALSFEIVMNQTDVWMAKLRKCACLAQEARTCIGIESPGLDGLQGDSALQPLVISDVDRAIPPSPSKATTLMWPIRFPKSSCSGMATPVQRCPSPKLGDSVSLRSATVCRWSARAQRRA